MSQTPTIAAWIIGRAAEEAKDAPSLQAAVREHYRQWVDCNPLCPNRASDVREHLGVLGYRVEVRA